VTPKLPQIAAPTLIAWGGRDEIATRAMQEALAASIPRARLSIDEGLGHAPHWEDPQGFAAKLTAFVDGLTPAG